MRGEEKQGWRTPTPRRDARGGKQVPGTTQPGSRGVFQPTSPARSQRGTEPWPRSPSAARGSPARAASAHSCCLKMKTHQTSAICSALPLKGDQTQAGGFTKQPSAWITQLKRSDSPVKHHQPERCFIIHKQLPFHLLCVLFQVLFFSEKPTDEGIRTAISLFV